MAYDLLLRRKTHTNWSMHSMLNPAFASCGDFAPDPIATTPDEQQYLAKLAVLRMKADSGDVAAQKEWKTTMANVNALRKKAAKGDDKAQRTVAILKESGIFSGVQSMTLGAAYFSKLSADCGSIPGLGVAVKRLHTLALRQAPPRQLGAVK